MPGIPPFITPEGILVSRSAPQFIGLITPCKIKPKNGLPNSKKGKSSSQPPFFCVPSLIFLGVKANHQPAKSFEIIPSFGMFRSLGESAEELRIRRLIFIRKIKNSALYNKFSGGAECSKTQIKQDKSINRFVFTSFSCDKSAWWAWPWPIIWYFLTKQLPQHVIDSFPHTHSHTFTGSGTRSNWYMAYCLSETWRCVDDWRISVTGYKVGPVTNGVITPIKWPKIIG